jgi:hypothetical protein
MSTNICTLFSGSYFFSSACSADVTFCEVRIMSHEVLSTNSFYANASFYVKTPPLCKR